MASERATEPRREAPTSRRRFLQGVAASTVVVVPGCTEAPGQDSDPGDTRTDEPVDEQVRAYERAVHERVNEVRRTHDRDTLEHHDGIAAVARAHSRDMVERDYFSHESPEGERPQDRMEEFIPEHCRGIGENIASVGVRPDDGPETVAERVVSGWMDSPGHRENLLREAFDEEGIGAATGDDRVLVTQNFCATNDLV